MTDTNLQNKARAVVLAALMVLSVMVGTIALSGGAAAAASQVTLSDDLVSGNEQVYINGSVGENGTVHAFVDSNGDGYYNDSETHIGSVGIDDYNDDNSYSISYNAPGESGSVNISVVQKQDDSETGSTDESSLLDGDKEDVSTTLKVDADAPVFGDESPEDDSTINQANADKITVPIEDANTSVSSMDVTVQNADDVLSTWEITPSADDGDGVAWNDDALVITPGEGDVPALVDGDYTVTVDATDEVGNENTTTFSFTVYSEGLTFTDANGFSNQETSDENQTVQVDVEAGSGSSLNNSTVELTISGDDYSETFDYEDDVYTNSSSNGEVGTFSVDPSASEDIPAFDDGSYTVTVSGKDVIGNSDETSYTFSVDTQGPTVKSVDLTDAALNISDTDSNDEQVVVTFESDDVDADSIEAVVSVNGNTETLSDFTKSNGEFVDSLSLDNSRYDGVENDSAIVNVTTATDAVDIGNDNGLTNLDADASNTTFAIDTVAPSVSKDSDLPATVSGYVNFTAHHSVSADEGNGLTYWVKVAGTDDDTYAQIESPSHVDTTEAAEGDFVLKVQSTDDAGNVHYVTEDFTVDNADPSVSYEGSDVLTGEVDIPSILDVQDNGTEDTTFYYTREDTVSAAESTANGLTSTTNLEQGTSFNVNDDTQDGAYVLVAVVDNPGYDGSPNPQYLTTVVESAVLNNEGLGVSTTENANDASLVNITVTSDVPLSTFNVTAETDDSYLAQSSSVFDQDDFENTSSSSESGYEYTLVTDEKRDGKHLITLENATRNQQTYSDIGDTASIKVDTGAPALEDADVTSANEDGMTVRLEFSESISSLTDFSDFNGESVTVADGSAFDGDGIVNVTVDNEVQIGGDTGLVANSVEEAYDQSDDKEADAPADTATTASADVTYEIQLSEGMNVISVPAETGAISLDSLHLDKKGVDSVMAYDHGEWDSYDAQTGEGDLTALEGGEGYIVKMQEDCGTVELDLNIENVPSDNHAEAISSEDLESGWNLVGAYQEGSQPVDQAMAPLPSSADWSVEKGYTGTNVNTLESGEGYWLFTNTDQGVHVPVDYTGMQSAQPTVANVEMMEAGENPDGLLTDGEMVTISADVSDDSLISSVTVDAPKLGLNDVELTQIGDTTTYQASRKIDLGDTTPGETYTLNVAAIDANSNVGYGQGTSLWVETNAPTGTIQSLSPSQITDAQTGDGNEATVTVSFDEAIANPNDVTINPDVDGDLTTTPSIESTSWADSKTLTADLQFADDNEDVTGVTLEVSGAEDAAGNTMSSVSTDYTVKTTNPTVSSITTVDRDGDGNVDAANVVFSESVVDSSITAGDYSIGGTTVDSVSSTVGADSDDDDEKVQLQLTQDTNEVSGTDAKTVSYTAGSTTDSNGNALADFSWSASQVTDSANVQVLSAEKTGTSTVELRFSEDVGTSSDGSGTITSSELSYSDGSTIEDSAESFTSGDVADGDKTITITVSTGDVTQTDVDGDDTISIDSQLNSAGADGTTISTQTVDIVDNEANP